jgi:hypothetical protein
MSPEARERSFDELARGLASGEVSRRRAIRLMGAALVGGALASLGIREAAGAPGGVAGRPECVFCDCGFRQRQGTRTVCIHTQTVCVQQAEGENITQACIRVCGGGQRPRPTEFICNLRPAGFCQEGCRGPA